MIAYVFNIDIIMMNWKSFKFECMKISSTTDIIIDEMIVAVMPDSRCTAARTLPSFYSPLFASNEGRTKSDKTYSIPSNTVSIWLDIYLKLKITFWVRLCTLWEKSIGKSWISTTFFEILAMSSLANGKPHRYRLSLFGNPLLLWW